MSWCCRWKGAEFCMRTKTTSIQYCYSCSCFFLSHNLVHWYVFRSIESQEAATFSVLCLDWRAPSYSSSSEWVCMSAGRLYQWASLSFSSAFFHPHTFSKLWNFIDTFNQMFGCLFVCFISLFIVIPSSVPKKANGQTVLSQWGDHGFSPPAWGLSVGSFVLCPLCLPPTYMENCKQHIHKWILSFHVARQLNPAYTQRQLASAPVWGIDR